jgi:hypothetical protein
LGGTGEVSTVSKQELDGAQAWDIDFRLFTFGYGNSGKDLFVLSLNLHLYGYGILMTISLQ